MEEEVDESIYFLELLQYFNSDRNTEFLKLISEGKELLAITVQSIKTARLKQQK